MEYRMIVNLVNPDPEHDDRVPSATLKYKVSFGYDPKQYGNGYSMALRPDEGYLEVFDLRYDRDFDSHDKMGFLYKFARNRWSGEDGSFRLDGITIERV